MGYVQLGAVFSPDSKEILIYGNSAQVYDLETGTLVGNFGGQEAISATFSHSGRYAAIATAEGDAGIYSTSASATAVAEQNFSGQLYKYPQWFQTTEQPDSLYQTHVYNESMYPGASGYISNSPSGQYIALTYPDGYVEVWDMGKKDGQSSFLLHEHYGAIVQTRVTDQYLLTAGYDGRIMVFDLTDGATTHFINTGGRIERFEVSRGGDMIIALAESGAYAQVYDLSSGKRIYTIVSSI